MARSGQFSRGAVSYGTPLSVVHPKNNKMPREFIDALYSKSLDLELEQKAELQDRIDDLYAVLRGERDYLT